MSRLLLPNEDATMNEVSEVQPAAANPTTAPNSLFLTILPPEIRNMIYKHCFPSLPSSPVPLLQAHLYLLTTDLIFANRHIWNETSGLMRPIVDAWRAMTWTVDLDALASQADTGKKFMLPHLSEEDAEMVTKVEFTTSAFALPLPDVQDDDDEEDRDEQARSVFRAPFSFTITRLPSTSDLVFTSPHFSTDADPDQHLDARYLSLLVGLKAYLGGVVDRVMDSPGPYMRRTWKKVLSMAAHGGAGVLGPSERGM